MRKIIIFLSTFLIFLVSQAQVGVNDSLNRGVSRTGVASNGCDCEEGQEFVTRRGNDTLVPRVTRTGQLLQVTAKVKDSIPGCGTTDEEVLVDLTITWKGNYLSKVIKVGVEYENITGVEEHIPGLICHEDLESDGLHTIVHQKDSVVAICRDSTIRLMLELLCPGSSYRISPYVITIDGHKVSGTDRIFTKERNKCGGWIANYDVENTSGGIDSIILVKDDDGLHYGVVQIGSQCWLRENMRCDNSPNRNILESPVDGVNAEGKTTYKTSEQIPYFYRYEVLNLSFRQRGNLYNWPAVVDTFGFVTELPPGKRRGICPKGWHLPDIYDWYELISTVLTDVPPLEQYHTLVHNNYNFYGNEVVNLSFGCDWGIHCDTCNTYPGGHMNDPENRNASFFSALPANNVQPDGSLGYYKNVANFWLATPDSSAKRSSTYAYSWHIDHDQHGVSSFPRTRLRGFSVRCLRDQLVIAVNPNADTFCVPSNITYTAKMASAKVNGHQVDQGDFSYRWKVDGNVISGVTQPTLTYTHINQGDYTVECEAHLDVNGNDSIFARDKVFVRGVGKCNLIAISPTRPCVGETVTVTAKRSGYNLTDNYDISWSINGNPVLDDNQQPITDTFFTYTFPVSNHDVTYTFEVTATPHQGYSTIYAETTLPVTVSSKIPTITVCPDCTTGGFLILKTTYIKDDPKVTNNVIWRDNQGIAVAYNRKMGDVVSITTNNSPYSIEMVSPTGCHDTVRNLWLKTPTVGCTVASINSNIETQGATANSIDSVKDHEKNSYAVVQIGDRCWMKENLRTTTSPKRPEMSFVNPVGLTGSSATRSYVSQVAHWYKNDPENKLHGLLYNWCAAADTFFNINNIIASQDAGPGSPWLCQLPANWRGICPEGWHLPTDHEWTAMEIELNHGDDFTNDTLAGLLAGSCDWTISNVEHSPGDYHNKSWGESLFRAMPAGHFAVKNNSFETMDQGSVARFWTASESSEIVGRASQRMLKYDAPSVNRNSFDMDLGMSVRCIRDIPQLVIHQRANDNCTHTAYATASGLYGENILYTWTINGVSVTTTRPDTTFSFDVNATSYNISCEVTMGNETYGDHISIELPSSNWPPTISLCADTLAYPIKVTTTNAASSIWLNANTENDTFNTSSYYVERDKGEYPVWLIHNNGACIPATVTVKTPKTYCWVPDPNITNNVEYVSQGEMYRIDSVKAGEMRYPVVQIGNQCWMRVNMRTTTDNNGNPLTFGNTPNTCTTNGTPTNNTPTYYDYCSSSIPLELRGYLYNQNAASKICPNGWHLPSQQEWLYMKQAVMGDNNQACLVAGGNDWTTNSSSNTCGNYNAEHRNASGLTIIPAGSMTTGGVFNDQKNSASFWTSTASTNNTTQTYKSVFDYNGNSMTQNYDENKRAFSVRCVRDNIDRTDFCYVINAHENDEYDNESLSSDNPYLIEFLHVDNVDYSVVQIGGRCWTKENLRTTKTVTGTPITQQNSGYPNNTNPVYYNFAPQYGFELEKSGYLYNWYAATQICPNGWHLPTKDEWKALSSYTGNANKLALDYMWSTNGCNNALDGSPCKCMSPQTSSDCNILGFSLVPAGNTDKSNGTFKYYKESANFWTATPKDSDNVYRVFFNHNMNIMNDTANNEPYDKKRRGFSVRCIRDL